MRELPPRSPWAAILRDHCAQVGRDPADILCTHLTGWLILAPTPAALEAKVRRYLPDGVEARYHGPWAGFAAPATPDQAVAYYQELAEAGVQHFIVETLDAADTETLHLLAKEVVPHVRRRAGQRSPIAA